MALARFRSLFSCSSYLSPASSSDVILESELVSTWVRETQVLRVSGEVPKRFDVIVSAPFGRVVRSIIEHHSHDSFTKLG
jgi:hypothetical protein